MIEALPISSPHSPQGCTAAMRECIECECAPGDRLVGSGDSESLGMPHLSLVGLSEEWFLREAGHRHWLSLERQLGIEVQRWVSERGDPLYASFVAARLRGPLLAGARVGDVVTWRSAESRSDGHVMVSSHSLHRVSDGARACVQLASTFVTRTTSGNHRFARHTMAGILRPVPLTSEACTCAARLLDARRHHRGMLPRERPTDYGLTIVPGEDFNAAGMVYFATMPRLLDRGEWHLACAEDPARRRDPLRPLVHRELYWYGNADAGDDIRVRHDHAEGRRISALTRVDGTLLCIARTHRT